MKRALTIVGFALLLLVACGFVYSGFIHVWQNAGSNIGTFTTYEVVNCSTGMSCSKSGSVITMTATGSGVSSVTGTANQITSSGGTAPTLSLPVAITAPGSLTATTSLAATTSVSGATYLTATNCSSSASPAVCGSAASGSVAIATGTVSETLTVNTTAVTANSQIILQVDETLSTKLSVTCDSALTEVIGGVTISARSAGASFQITHSGNITTNPLCLSYTIVN